MTDHADNNEFVDPIKEASESLLYGDPDTAAEKLRTAIHFEAARLNAHQARDGRLRAAHSKSMAALNKFMEENDAYKDPVVQAAGKAAMCSEQYADLVNSGFLDVAKFKEQTGRAPTEQDVFNWHLQARANDVRGIRSEEVTPKVG
jgi:hypothetical protein